MKPQRVVAVILARLGSQRFPGKVLASLAEKPLLLHVVDAARGANNVDEVVLATSVEERDDRLVTAARDAGVSVFRGSESDVLARFAGAMQDACADVAVRLTVDNPLVPAGLIERVVARHMQTGADYTCNFIPPSFPDGLEVEVITNSVLERVCAKACTAEEREHVTWYIRTHMQEFYLENLAIAAGKIQGWEQMSLSVDTVEDLERVEAHYSTWRKILADIY